MTVLKGQQLSYPTRRLYKHVYSAYPFAGVTEDCQNYQNTSLLISNSTLPWTSSHHPNTFPRTPRIPHNLATKGGTASSTRTLHKVTANIPLLP